MFNPSLFHAQHLSIPGNEKQHLRVVEYVHRYLIPSLVKSFLNVESPQQPGNADERSLFRKCLACTDTPPPSESHIPALIWKGSMMRAVFQKPLGLESIGIREIFLVPMDCPNIALCPSILRYQPSLFASDQ